MKIRKESEKDKKKKLGSFVKMNGSDPEVEADIFNSSVNTIVTTSEVQQGSNII